MSVNFNALEVKRIDRFAFPAYTHPHIQGETFHAN